MLTWVAFLNVNDHLYHMFKGFKLNDARHFYTKSVPKLKNENLCDG